jgi:hypothetical protein
MPLIAMCAYLYAIATPSIRPVNVSNLVSWLRQRIVDTLSL